MKSVAVILLMILRILVHGSGQNPIQMKKFASQEPARMLEFGCPDTYASAKVSWPNNFRGLKAVGTCTNGLHDGELLILDSLGNLLFQENYRAGLLDGKKLTYKDSVVILIEEYKAGIKQGLTVGYNVAGKKVFEEMFENGMAIGRKKYFDEGGQEMLFPIFKSSK